MIFDYILGSTDHRLRIQSVTGPKTGKHLNFVARTWDAAYTADCDQAFTEVFDGFVRATFVLPANGEDMTVMATIYDADGVIAATPQSFSVNAYGNQIIDPSGASSLTEKVVLSKGFRGDMFGVPDVVLRSDIDALCNLKSIEVKCEIGASAFASIDELVAYQVEKAIIELVTAELWGRRKARILRSAMESGDSRNRAGLSEENAEQVAMDKYMTAINQVNALLGRSGTSFGAETSNHFGRTE